MSKGRGLERALAQQYKSLFGRSAVTVIPLLVLACQTQAPDEVLRGRLVHVEPTSSPEPIFFLEDPGTIIVSEPDRICGDSVGEEGFTAVALQGEFELPTYADRATVFLNGWSAQYLEDDHHVKSLAAAIRDIELDGDTLSWLAVGWIWDKSGDDPYRFCYTRTVLGWNSSAIDVEVDHDNNRLEVNGVETEFHNGTFRDTVAALTSISSRSGVPLSSRPPVAKDAAAVLPRGFRIEFEETDHHLIQVAYSLDHNEFFVESGNEYDFLGPVDETRVHPFSTSWETYGILKDNAVSRRFFFLADPTVVVGNDISVVRPPFTVLPTRHISDSFDFPFAEIGCPSTVGQGVRRDDIEISNIPFEYAIPVLSGWDLSYPCDDEEVTEVGIWLENINYEKDPGEPTGTLRYTVASVLRDKDLDPGHDVRHKVDILGLNGRDPADLVPIPHDADVDFCNQDQEDRLVVGVSNIADGPAPASITRVAFDQGSSVDVDTPEIPGNFSGEVEAIDLPAECTGGCLFTITVDARPERVAELDEGNNVTEGRCSR